MPDLGWFSQDENEKIVTSAESSLRIAIRNSAVFLTAYLVFCVIVVVWQGDYGGIVRLLLLAFLLLCVWFFLIARSFGREIYVVTNKRPVSSGGAEMPLNKIIRISRWFNRLTFRSRWRRFEMLDLERPGEVRDIVRAWIT